MSKMSVSLILFKGKTLASGAHSVMLQYYVNGRAKRKTLASCLPEEWDHKNKRLKPKARNSSTINLFLSEQFTEAERLMFEVQMGNIDKAQVLNPQKELTVADAYDLEMVRYKSGNMVSTYRRIESNKRTLSAMVDLDVPLSDIDLHWFHSLAKALKLKGHTGSTDSKIIKTARSIIARHVTGALPENVKAFRVPTSKTVKQKLTGEELAAVEGLVIKPGTTLAIARDIFLLQVYLRGIRIGDILQARCDAFAEGRFTYSADKTGKQFTIALIAKAQAIIDRYRTEREYLFPMFQWSPNPKLPAFDNELRRIAEISACTTIVNKHLKEVARLAGINKPLTTHIARHTFARMAIDKINNPMITMELLGHSSLTVHQQYLKDIRKDEVLDQAAAGIFG
jgi:integrase/recombinase XerD